MFLHEQMRTSTISNEDPDILLLTPSRLSPFVRPLHELPYIPRRVRYGRHLEGTWTGYLAKSGTHRDRTRQEARFQADESTPENNITPLWWEESVSIIVADRRIQFAGVCWLPVPEAPSRARTERSCSLVLRLWPIPAFLPGVISVAEHYLGRSP